MFDPIKASKDIKESYIDYITTTFDMADSQYKKEFLEELRKEGMIAKGPFLDIGGSFEVGHTLQELINNGSASPLFEKLEPVAEKDRELKLNRPLYRHQETSLIRASAGENLVVTTGTGSGKTESFLIPVINHLLREEESGTLGAGVRAIIIYPMNALANDQMKRMRTLLKGYPQICYGVYNGNTEHSQQRALSVYQQTYFDNNGNPLEPMPNEIISREVMQRTPPHILITNYSMLEYMMLRPKDDAVFSGAKLKFIVLDEAHIYKGATGMETSLLMRRLRARISEPDSVQYILTSATLGGPDSNKDIIDFAEKLCGVSFKADGIIRSTEMRPKIIDLLDFPPQMFEDLAQRPNDVESILCQYQANFAQDKTTEEKLYELFLRTKLFDKLRSVAHEPITVSQLRNTLSTVCPLTNEQVVAFIAVCARAEKDGASLIKPRYHFFVRAIEGAFITLRDPKHLYLQRKMETYDLERETSVAVFEAATCTDCGRIALVGHEDAGFLRHFARKGIDDASEYFYVKEFSDGELMGEPEDEEDHNEGFDDYVICPTCGAIATEADCKFDALCEHDRSNYVHVRKVTKNHNGMAKCPACGFGSFRRFYLGSEAATAVLGTELFEQLPSEEVIIPEASQVQTRRSVFSKAPQQRQIRRKKARQFLCFSDSRSEAAFFASYMERSYQEFLRRRGIWHTAEKFRAIGRGSVSVAEFVNELSRYFEDKKSFADWNTPENQLADILPAISRSNAWVAILNEMVNARRGTSLVSMGVLSFEFRKNDEVVTAFQEAYGLEESDARSLLELLAQDAVYSGAIDAGQDYTLTAAEREYIFFTPTAKKLVLLKTADNAKKSWISGWRGRKRTNGNYYPNSRMTRLIRALNITDDDADALLCDYWENVFEAETEEFALDANDFRINIGGLPNSKFYRCKRCGRITPYNVKNQCPSVKCPGVLEDYDPLTASEGNHYARLYRSDRADPLYIKEHTAQLAKDQQTAYQEAFVQKKINALSCSTTFEMGVDVGSLETVYMRDVPPSPANYVQRAGRAGRARQSTAFVMTYAKLSSHDFTYYQDPPSMISGKIKAPVFEIENEKILNRHIFAVAMSAFLAAHNDVYAGDDQTVLLNEGGYERLKDYLATKPEHLKSLLVRSIPANMHRRLGIDDFSWVERLCGEDGVLDIAVQDFRGTVAEMEKELAACRRRKDDEAAGAWSRNLRNFRCSKEDNAGKKSLIGFLVRNNVLPKYGFPVDTVELIPDITNVGRGKSLQLARDLQMAIAEYAPGAQVVADGKMYVSRYIRKLPGKNTETAWEKGFYCPNCPTCGQPNFTKEPVTNAGRECVSCHNVIKRFSWLRTLEPRMGFCAENEVRDVPMHRPEHDYKTDDYYIGDPHRNLISKLSFQVNDQLLQVESTSNDSLVVIGQTGYKVCPVCGYAKEEGIPLSHKTMRGYICTNNEGKGIEFRLSHDFKTDVAKITFVTQEATNRDVMLSVLYALLEGISREMGIERTDIKGCLFRTYAEGLMLYSLVLYDSVAGGAGHVRRIVTDDGGAFQRVLERAINVVDGCDCDCSCYKCLRNYYNQKIHDNLNRQQASAFLHQWQGRMTLVEDNSENREDGCSN